MPRTGRVAWLLEEGAGTVVLSIAASEEPEPEQEAQHTAGPGVPGIEAAEVPALEQAEWRTVASGEPEPEQAEWRTAEPGVPGIEAAESAPGVPALE